MCNKDIVAPALKRTIDGGDICPIGLDSFNVKQDVVFTFHSMSMSLPTMSPFEVICRPLHRVTFQRWDVVK